MVATLIVPIVFFWFLGQRLVHAENLHMSYAGSSAYNVTFWVTKRPACLPSTGRPPSFCRSAGS